MARPNKVAVEVVAAVVVEVVAAGTAEGVVVAAGGSLSLGHH